MEILNERPQLDENSKDELTRVEQTIQRLSADLRQAEFERNDERAQEISNSLNQVRRQKTALLQNK